MTAKLPAELLIQIISRFPNGATLEEISLGLYPTPSRRTLQRWLSNLCKEERLTLSGRTRGARYHLFLGKFPLFSEEGRKIQREISVPLELRQPAVYKREFLDSYQPNITFYLSPNVRSKLLAMGGSTKVLGGTYKNSLSYRA